MNQLLRIERGQLRVLRRYFRIAKFLYQTCMVWFSWVLLGLLGHYLLELVKTIHRILGINRKVVFNTKRIDYFTIQCKQLATKPSLSRESYKAWHYDIKKFSSHPEYQSSHGKATPIYLLQRFVPFLFKLCWIYPYLKSLKQLKQIWRVFSLRFWMSPLPDYSVGFYLALKET